MSKKVIIVIVAAVLLLTAVPVLAATPSKTTEDLTRIVSVNAEDGTLHNEIVAIQKVASEFAQDAFQNIVEFSKTPEPIIHFFPEEVGAFVQELLPPEVDEHKLVMSEFVPLVIGEHDFQHGTVSCTIQFPTVFSETKTVVAILGYLDANGNAVWVPLETKIANGLVTVIIPDTVLTAAGQNAVLSLLSN